MRTIVLVSVVTLALIAVGQAAAEDQPFTSEVYVTDYGQMAKPKPPTLDTANKIVDAGRTTRLEEDMTDIEPESGGICRDIIVSANNQIAGSLAWYDVRLEVFFCYRTGAPYGTLNYVSYCFRRRWVENARTPWSFGQWISYTMIGGQGYSAERCGAELQTLMEYDPPWIPVWGHEERTPRIRIVAAETGAILEARAWQT